MDSPPEDRTRARLRSSRTGVYRLVTIVESGPRAVASHVVERRAVLWGGLQCCLVKVVGRMVLTATLAQYTHKREGLGRIWDQVERLFEQVDGTVEFAAV
jgi:hypothetical protein